MSKVTAVAKVYSREAVAPAGSGEGETRLKWIAPYSDADGNRLNQEWAKYTPCFNLDMVVLDSVAEKFEDGAEYLLTFEKKRD